MRMASGWILALLFSGCLEGDAVPSSEATQNEGGGDGAAQDAGDPSASLGDEPQPPPPIFDRNTVIVGADPSNVFTGRPCSDDTSTCFRYGFILQASNFVNGTVLRLEADLDWLAPTNDFDLYLYKGLDQLDASAQAAPGTSEELTHRLTKPGAYELVVVAWLVVQDTYELRATFAYV